MTLLPAGLLLVTLDGQTSSDVGAAQQRGRQREREGRCTAASAVYQAAVMGRSDSADAYFDLADLLVAVAIPSVSAAVST